MKRWRQTKKQRPASKPGGGAALTERTSIKPRRMFEAEEQWYHIALKTIRRKRHRPCLVLNPRSVSFVEPGFYPQRRRGLQFMRWPGQTVIECSSQGKDTDVQSVNTASRICWDQQPSDKHFAFDPLKSWRRSAMIDFPRKHQHISIYWCSGNQDKAAPKGKETSSSLHA